MRGQRSCCPSSEKFELGGAEMDAFPEDEAVGLAAEANQARRLEAAEADAGLDAPPGDVGREGRDTKGAVTIETQNSGSVTVPTRASPGCLTMYSSVPRGFFTNDLKPSATSSK